MSQAESDYYTRQNIELKKTKKLDVPKATDVEKSTTELANPFETDEEAKDSKTSMAIIEDNILKYDILKMVNEETAYYTHPTTDHIHSAPTETSTSEVTESKPVKDDKIKAANKEVETVSFSNVVEVNEQFIAASKPTSDEKIVDTQPEDEAKDKELLKSEIVDINSYKYDILKMSQEEAEYYAQQSSVLDKVKMQTEPVSDSGTDHKADVIDKLEEVVERPKITPAEVRKPQKILLEEDLFKYDILKMLQMEVNYYIRQSLELQHSKETDNIQQESENIVVENIVPTLETPQYDILCLQNAEIEWHEQKALDAIQSQEQSPQGDESVDPSIGPKETESRVNVIPESNQLTAKELSGVPSIINVFDQITESSSSPHPASPERLPQQSVPKTDESILVTQPTKTENLKDTLKQFILGEISASESHAYSKVDPLKTDDNINPPDLSEVTKNESLEITEEPQHKETAPGSAVNQTVDEKQYQEEQEEVTLPEEKSSEVTSESVLNDQKIGEDVTKSDELTTKVEQKELVAKEEETETKDLLPTEPKDEVKSQEEGQSESTPDTTGYPTESPLSQEVPGKVSQESPIELRSPETILQEPETKEMEPETIVKDLQESGESVENKPSEFEAIIEKATEFIPKSGYSTSDLSSAASEFVPKSETSRLNPNAAEFIPGSDQKPTDYVDYATLYKPQQEIYEENPVWDYSKPVYNLPKEQEQYDSGFEIPPDHASNIWVSKILQEPSDEFTLPEDKKEKSDNFIKTEIKDNSADTVYKTDIDQEKLEERLLPKNVVSELKTSNASEIITPSIVSWTDRPETKKSPTEDEEVTGISSQQPISEQILKPIKSPKKRKSKSPKPTLTEENVLIEELLNIPTDDSSKPDEPVNVWEAARKMGRTYADIVASHIPENTKAEMSTSPPRRTTESVHDIKIEVTESSEPQEPLTVADDEGFIEIVSKKDKRSHSRSRQKQVESASKPLTVSEPSGVSDAEQQPSHEKVSKKQKRKSRKRSKSPRPTEESQDKAEPIADISIAQVYVTEDAKPIEMSIPKDHAYESHSTTYAKMVTTPNRDTSPKTDLKMDQPKNTEVKITEQEKPKHDFDASLTDSSITLEPQTTETVVESSHETADDFKENITETEKSKHISYANVIGIKSKTSQVKETQKLENIAKGQTKEIIKDGKDATTEPENSYTPEKFTTEHSTTGKEVVVEFLQTESRESTDFITKESADLKQPSESFTQQETNQEIISTASNEPDVFIDEPKKTKHKSRKQKKPIVREDSSGAVEKTAEEDIYQETENTASQTLQSVDRYRLTYADVIKTGSSRESSPQVVKPVYEGLSKHVELTQPIILDKSACDVIISESIPTEEKPNIDSEISDFKKDVAFGKVSEATYEDMTEQEDTSSLKEIDTVKEVEVESAQEITAVEPLSSNLPQLEHLESIKIETEIPSSVDNELNVHQFIQQEIIASQSEKDIHHKSYAEILGKEHTFKEKALTEHEKPSQPKQKVLAKPEIQIEVVGESKPEHIIETDSEGFVPIISKRDRSRSRSRTKSRKEQPEEKQPETLSRTEVSNNEEPDEIIEQTVTTKKVTSIEQTSSPTKSWASIVKSKKEDTPSTKQEETVLVSTAEVQLKRETEAEQTETAEPAIDKTDGEKYDQIVKTPKKKKDKSSGFLGSIISTVKNAVSSKKDDIPEKSTEEESQEVDKRKPKKKKNKKQQQHEDKEVIQEKTHEDKEVIQEKTHEANETKATKETVQVTDTSLVHEFLQNEKLSTLEDVTQKSTPEDSTLKETEEHKDEKRGSFISSLVSKVTGPKKDTQSKAKDAPESEKSKKKKKDKKPKVRRESLGDETEKTVGEKELKDSSEHYAADNIVLELTESSDHIVDQIVTNAEIDLTNATHVDTIKKEETEEPAEKIEKVDKKLVELSPKDEIKFISWEERDTDIQDITSKEQEEIVINITDVAKPESEIILPSDEMPSSVIEQTNDDKSYVEQTATENVKSVAAQIVIDKHPELSYSEQVTLETERSPDTEKIQNVEVSTTEKDALRILPVTEAAQGIKIVDDFLKEMKQYEDNIRVVEPSLENLEEEDNKRSSKIKRQKSKEDSGDTGTEQKKPGIIKTIVSSIFDKLTKRSKDEAIDHKQTLVANMSKDDKVWVTKSIYDESEQAWQTALAQQKGEQPIYKQPEIETQPAAADREIDVLRGNLEIDEPVWLTKRIYDEAEEIWQSNVAQRNKSQASGDKKKPSDGSPDRDDDSDSSDGGGASPGNKPDGEPFGRSGPGSEYMIYSLPGGIAGWKEQSTYLALEPAEPISVVPLGAIEEGGDANKTSSDQRLTVTSDLQLFTGESGSAFATADEHLSAAQRLAQSVAEDVISDDTSPDYIPDQNVPPLGPQKQPTVSTGLSESSTGADGQLKKDLTEDVQKLQQSLKSTESSIEFLPKEGFDEMIKALEDITSDLKKHAAEAIRLESQVNLLTSDHETQALAAHLAGIRTRIATLLSQAENGRIVVSNARQQQIKKQEELTHYQVLLTEIEVWLETTRTIIENFVKPVDETGVQNYITDFEKLNSELEEKEEQLRKLAKVCEEFRKYPDLRLLVAALLEQLQILTAIFDEQKLIITTKLENLKEQLVELKEQKVEPVQTPDLSLENTLDSTSMPIEEIPVHVDTKKATEEFVLKEAVSQPGVHIETQTGRSLTSPVEEPVTKDFTVTYNEPVDAQIQTHMSQTSSEVEPPHHKESIKISKRTVGDQETIQIATKPMASEAQPIVEEPDDVLVEANYRKRPESETKSTELNITNVAPNQSFETVFVEPDETTTEVIVDADGTKRIIVKKLHRTVVRHQQSTQQQQLTTLSTLTEGDVPVSQSFSQVTLQGHQSATTVAKGDGSKSVLTCQQYGGKVVTGVPGGDIDVQEYQTEPETHYTVTGATLKPEEVEVQGIKLHEGDVTFVDKQNNQLIPADRAQVLLEGSQIHTSSSSVRAVVQQVTRRIIRKTRRIIRRTVIIDGKEHVTEEVVEEPEEVEVTEEGIPRVSINVTRTEDGTIVQEQQFGEPVAATFEHPEVTVTQKVTTVVLDAEGKPVENLPENVILVSQPDERYVLEQHTAPLPESAPQVTEPVQLISEKDIKTVSPGTVSDFLENERYAVSQVDSSKVDLAPSVDAAPKSKEQKEDKDKKTPEDESSFETQTKESVFVTSTDVRHPIEEKIVSPVEITNVIEVTTPPQVTEHRIDTPHTQPTEVTKDAETEVGQYISIQSPVDSIDSTTYIVEKHPLESTDLTPQEKELISERKETVIETVTPLEKVVSAIDESSKIVDFMEPVIEKAEPISETRQTIVETIISPEKDISLLTQTSKIVVEPSGLTTDIIITPDESVKISEVVESVIITPKLDETVDEPKPEVAHSFTESQLTQKPTKSEAVTTQTSFTTPSPDNKEHIVETVTTQTLVTSPVLAPKEPSFENTDVQGLPESPAPSAPPYEEVFEVNPENGAAGISITSLTQDFILAEQLHEPVVPTEGVKKTEESPKSKKKRKFSKSKKISGTPRTQSPDVPAYEEELLEKPTEKIDVPLEKSPAQILPETKEIIESKFTTFDLEPVPVLTDKADLEPVPVVTDKADEELSELKLEQSPDRIAQDTTMKETTLVEVVPVVATVKPTDTVGESREPIEVVPTETIKVQETETVTSVTTMPFGNVEMVLSLEETRPEITLTKDFPTEPEKQKLTSDISIKTEPPRMADKPFPSEETHSETTVQTKVSSEPVTIMEKAVVSSLIAKPSEDIHISLSLEETQPEEKIISQKEKIEPQFTTEVLKIEKPNLQIQDFLENERISADKYIKIEKQEIKQGIIPEVTEGGQIMTSTATTADKEPETDLQKLAETNVLHERFTEPEMQPVLDIKHPEAEEKPEKDTLEFHEELKDIKIHPETDTTSVLEVKQSDAAKEIRPVEILDSVNVQKTDTVISKPKEPAQEVDIVLSLEEKYEDSTIATPKVSVAMRIEEGKAMPAEILQKDIHVQLPTATTETTSVTVAPIVPKLAGEHEEPSTPSDIDHGGRRSKKKKKHKTSSETVTPSIEKEEFEEKLESTISSLAESTEIEIPEDSVKSEETPKPTIEEFEPVSESEEDTSGKGKDTGYEADKTTVDESLADDDDHEHKKRRKKKRRQKVKVKESEESNVPKSVYESSPLGESVPLTDDEPTKVPEVEDIKKTKKRRKGKRKQSESEPEIESETIFEAQDEEILSPNESYHTMSTPSEPGTVKIIEEKVVSRPASESPQELTSKIVTTVPILEAVITQETVSQTSPEISPIRDVTAEFLEQEKVVVEKSLEQVSIQTSPEVPKETAESSIQTMEEPKPVEIVKPDVQESSTQIELITTEIVTQTTPKSQSPEEKVVTETKEISTQIEPTTSEIVTQTTPKPQSPDEKVVTETTETSIQTASPEKIEITEESVQTISPEITEIPTTDSEMQTTIVESQEVYAQTKSPEIITTETATQAKPDITELALQTSPEPSGPPLEEVQEVLQPPIEKDILSPPAEAEIVLPALVKVETTETLTQTSPVLIKDFDELGLPTPSPSPVSSEQYEIHVKASVTVPPDVSESTSEEKFIISHTANIQPEVSPALEFAITEGSVSSTPILAESEVSKTETLDKEPSDSDESSANEFDVQVTIDGTPVDKHSVLTFLDAERVSHDSKKPKRKRHKKHKKHQDEPRIEKDLFAEFHRQNTVDNTLDPKDLYSEVAKRESRSSSPVPQEELEEKETLKMAESKKELDTQRPESEVTETETSKKDIEKQVVEEAEVRRTKIEHKVSEPERSEKEIKQGIIEQAEITSTDTEFEPKITIKETEKAEIIHETTKREIEKSMIDKDEITQSETEYKESQLDKSMNETENAGTESAITTIEIDDKEVQKGKIPSEPEEMDTKKSDESKKELPSEEPIQPIPEEHKESVVPEKIEKYVDDREAEVVSKIFTDINEETVQKISERQKHTEPAKVQPESPEEVTTVQVSITIPQESASSSPDIEITSKDILTVSGEKLPKTTFTVDSILTETELKDQTSSEPITISDNTNIEIKDQPMIEEVQLQSGSTEVPQKSNLISSTLGFLEAETIPQKPFETKDDLIFISDKPIKLQSSEEQIAMAVPAEDQKPKQAPTKTKGKGKHIASVTIEEIESPTIVTDTPLTPVSDVGPLSPPDFTTTVWQKPAQKEISQKFIESETQQAPILFKEVNVRWNQAQALERFKNLQNARKTTHLSDVLYLATLHEIVTDETVEQRNDNVQQNLIILQEAVEKQDVVVIQETIITTVETITTWLQTIEYRIYVNRQQTSDGPSKERVQEFNALKQEIANIEQKVEQLQYVMQQADGIYNDDERQRMQDYIESLQKQVRVIEEVTEENEQLAAGDLNRWEEFIDGVTNVSHLVHQVKRQLSELRESDASPQTKLNELEKLESNNRCHVVKAVHLTAAAKSLMRDFPTREIPKDVYLINELTKHLEHQITIEREKALQFLSLADEYEQTLKEFSQIIIIAEALVESPISVRNLEHLEDEMQNHRKFFVNLSHCRAILESLEENLDSETRAIHSELHQNLYERAKIILDKSTGRFQSMSLAASRWTVLEQGTREEMRWLQVAQQRIPDLNTVTSSDYDRFIDLYQSLALDMSHHHTKLAHLNSVAQKLQELVYCSGLEQAYTESLEIIQKLEEDVQNSLERLLAFRDSWSSYNILSDRVEYWLRDAETQLRKIAVPSGPRGHLRQFWELKAQHEVHNAAKQNATNALEKSLQIVPISDEMLQRKFHSELNDQWKKVSKKISDIEASVIETISAPDIPVNEKLILLEQELQDLKTDIDNLQGIIKTEEELNLYVERLQIMSTRLETIQNELGRLGLLSAGESDKVGSLLALSKRLEIVITEELEGGNLLKERIQAIQKGLGRVRRKHSELSKNLDQCESAEKLGSEAVEKAVTDCYEVGEELVTLWQDLMILRQLLHTLPMRLKVTVSPVKVERDISQLQDDHTALEKRCGQILALLRSRLALWQRFERQLELVQQSVQEADFMVELLTVQGTVDYERLRKATERLESVSVDLVSRESLVSELKNAAKPLADSCSPEVSARVEAAVNEAVTAYTTTCSNLKDLCTKYHHAADLWKQYKEAADLVREWIENPMESVGDLEPEEAIEKVKVCEETLAAHTKRLAELQQLVSGIASAVGLDANALLGGEVEALGKRLEDVRESLTALADVAECKVKTKREAQSEINGARNYLDSVQKSIGDLDIDSEEKLLTLREHLLALSKAEGQIQKIKDKAIEISTTKTETSVIEILELWQQVFRETFQQYHRLSTRLVKNEDGAAALKLWQEYLINVQQFLQGTIPGDYHSLSEHQHLCQVHQNLLTTQQNVLKPSDKQDTQLASGLVETSVMEQFNSLTNLHNETLSRIMDRHTEVQNRLNAWERYKQDQNKLLSWLKNIEKERERMQLRYMHIRRIPKLLSRIQNLLDQIPQGEEQTENLQRQQNLLLQFCDDALATSIRMEHVAIKQRISNLHAGLDTWKQFLERISLLVKTHDDRVSKVQKIFDEVQDVVNESVALIPTSHAGVSNRLDILQRTRERLNATTKDLEQLGLTQEQLKECLSPSDMKTINQRMWLLWHQQGDLEHQLSTLCHQLEEKLGVRSMFETRQARFISWVDELEKRLDQETEGSPTVTDPKELLRKLETELQAEMALKEREYNWLLKTGKELVDSCGEEYADVTAKQIIQARTDEVFVRWERLESLGRNKANKIHDMMQTILQLEERIAQIRAWLTQIELQLAKPLVFEACTKDVIDRKLQEHEKLKKSIENESGNIGEVLNLCELLLSDTDASRAHFSTENITHAIQNLEKRWKVVCGQSAERKRKISFIWKLLQEVLKLSNDQEQWLAEKEQRLKDLDKPVKKLSREEIQGLIYEIENEIKDIESRTPAFQILEQTYSKLATATGTEPENIQELTSRARVIIARWENLMPKAQSILQMLQNELTPFKEFSLAHEDAVVGLSKIDAQLTELQHLSPPEKVTSKERLQKLEAIERHLASQTPILENADKLGLQIMKKSKKPEVAKIQEMIDEYQLLCKDIHERITLIKTEIRTEIKQQPREVDESVQVETLKFEQDTAVQVNTLPPQLQRMTSISAKDAYLVELEAALVECRSSLGELEAFVNKEIPKQGSPELPTSGKKIAKMSAKCQASIELVKHLHDLLVNECDATEIEACSEEVRILIERFEVLLVRAKEREQQLRELSEAGRLLCPLCTKRNWAQLDNDLWRLEKWLQVAEGTQKTQKNPPSNIEQLEDVIQDQREFLLDLDSHKSIVRSLNIVGTHLADHTEDTSRADELRSRLEADNKRWDVICRYANDWQIQLQRALMDNQQFHNIISELCVWLEKNEKRIRASEPVDLTAATNVIESKYHNFLELRAELERCEPRVLSLQEAANQLLREDEAPEGSSLICRRLTELRLKLQSLIRLTGVYTLKLGAVLGRDPSEIGLAIAASSSAPPLHSLSYDLLDEPSQDQPTTSAPDDSAHNGSDDALEINTSVLRKGYRFLGRVVRASVPIQALMLLILGAASLVPYSEEDYSCSLVNSIANSLTPTLRYNDGPPPI